MLFLLYKELGWKYKVWLGASLEGLSEHLLAGDISASQMSFYSVEEEELVSLRMPLQNCFYEQEL